MGSCSSVSRLAKETYFSKEEVRAKLETLQEQFPDGYVNIDTLCSAYGLAEYKTTIAQLLDTNADGRVSIREFIAGVSVLTRGSLEERVESAFAVYDLDNSHYLELPELCALFRVVLALPHAQGQALDTVEIDVEAKRLARRLLATVDSGAKGRLSVDEFKIAVRQDPQLMRPLLALMVTPQQPHLLDSETLARMHAAASSKAIVSDPIPLVEARRDMMSSLNSRTSGTMSPTTDHTRYLRVCAACTGINSVSNALTANF